MNKLLAAGFSPLESGHIQEVASKMYTIGVSADYFETAIINLVAASSGIFITRKLVLSAWKRRYGKLRFFYLEYWHDLLLSR